MSKLLFEFRVYAGVLKSDFSQDVQATFQVLGICWCVGKRHFLGCPSYFLSCGYMQVCWKATFLGMSQLLFEFCVYTAMLESGFSWHVAATF